MSTVEAPHKFIYIGDPRELCVMTIGVSSKDLYQTCDIKRDDQMTDKLKRGSFRITIQVDNEEKSFWLTKFSKIDKNSGIQIKFKRMFI